MRIKQPLLALGLPALLSVLLFEPLGALAQRIVAVYPGHHDANNPGADYPITVFDTNGVVTNISNRFVSNPYGVATDSGGNIYVGNIANCTNGRVAKYGPDYHLINPALIHTPANSPPGALAVDPSGFIYVSRYPKGTVLKYDPVGNLVTNNVKGRDWGFATADFGNSSLACDRNGNIYCSSNEAIVREYNGGVLIHALAGNTQGVATDTAGIVYLLDASSSATTAPQFVCKVHPDDPDGSLITNFAVSPEAVCGLIVDNSGNFYVGCGGRENGVKEYDANGKFVRSFPVNFGYSSFALQTLPQLGVSAAGKQKEAKGTKE